jgi:hypothetical protein
MNDTVWGYIYLGTFAVFGWTKYALKVRHHRKCLNEVEGRSLRVVHELSTILNAVGLDHEGVKAIRRLAADADATPVIRAMEEATKDLPVDGFE